MKDKDYHSNNFVAMILVELGERNIPKELTESIKYIVVWGDIINSPRAEKVLRILGVPESEILEKRFKSEDWIS
jgi:hypothetical protein